MSGRIHDQNEEYSRFESTFRLGAEFEADLQCALTNSAPVLITGPAELASAVATRIHRKGINRNGAFLTVDCGRAHSPEQLDVVLAAAASRGTVFLRDVDRLAPSLQAFLNVRLLPLGVRVIASTSTSLLHATAKGSFDERLFYRLNQIHLIAFPDRTMGAA